MSVTRRLVAVAATVTLAAGTAVATAPASSAAPNGNRSLATVLTSDGNTFDRDSHDFDITTEAVLAVLAAKPDSAVGALTKGRTALTAFVPTDAAFRALVKDLTGKQVAKERKVFAAVAGLGIDTVETVLLYHVVVGATITAKQALAADGSTLTTAQGGDITVDVRNAGKGVIRLQDVDTDDADARTVPRLLNLNKGNKQIAHGISRVLRPVDL